MAVIKCKMCGGDLKVIEGESVCECEYCGSRQTVPSVDNEKKMTLFSRAGRLLRNCEFDKAAGVFESIVADFPEEAEAYWGLVLCKYGIEYVDDPATGKKIPTCHRSSFESVLDDSNFEQACENADAVARRVYRDEARAIEDLRKGIIEVSGKEEPYDIFISYKETDGNGDRTLDSVIAQDIYTELTEKGYRVFFSRISLEGKLGIEYEPYIFAALNSAKVMIVVGTDYENFDAVWVKNEWSRFLKLIASGQKKTLIPVFKNMDAYDMPKEFAKLSAQDMGKVGAMQDLLRGVEKLIPRKKQENAQKERVTEKVIVQQSEGSMKTDAAIKRGMMALEDGEWAKAKEYFDQALTLDAENAEAYFGLALADFQAKDPDSFIRDATAQKPSTEKLTIPENTAHIKKATTENEVPGFLKASDLIPLYQYELSYPSTVKGQKEIQTQVRKQIDSNRNLSRAFRFAEGEEKARIENFRKTLFEELQKKVEEAQKQEEVNRNRAKQDYEVFLKETDKKVKEMNRSACREREEAYQNACALQQNSQTVQDFRAAIAAFESVSGYKDADQRVKQCQNSISEIWEAKHQERAQRKLEERQAAKKKKKTSTIIAGILIAAAAFFILWYTVIVPKQKLNKAKELLNTGDYEAAYTLLEEIGNSEAIVSSKYDRALKLINARKYDAALLLLEGLNYADSEEQIEKCYIGKYGEKAGKLILDTQIGDIFTFGSYEQDNNTSNGKEGIKWIVLDKDGTSFLLLSKYALDAKPYNYLESDVTWETCALRKWLNKEFLNTAFSAIEQAVIPTITVSADKNPYQDTSPGNNTQDQIFLLSIPEVKKYFSSEAERQCKPTDYAKEQGCYTSSNNDNCDWWLRSPGSHFKSYSYNAFNNAVVDAFGTVHTYGDSVSKADNAVRPALWINLATPGTFVT